MTTNLRSLLLFTLLTTGQVPSLAQTAETPAHHFVSALVSSAALPDQPYLAFPALLDLGNEVLISFKHGRSHAADNGATLDVLHLGDSLEAPSAPSTLAKMDGKIMQMGEWARFANGDIASYIDAQQKEVPTRIGLRMVRSTDGGRSFGPVERVGPVDGVEYGYAFEAITHGTTTWMLVMTFGNLEGGHVIHDTRSLPGSVDVIRSEDNGHSWHFVRSITQELGGAAINESSFAIHGDGFIVAARGYDRHQWLMLADKDFKLQRKVDLAAAHSFIQSVIGRPRVFTRDGGWYLLARNFIEPGVSKGGPMRLSLFKFDPITLAITRHVLLDNAERANVTDGYYAMPFWRQRAGSSILNIVTYKRLASAMPDIIRLEFPWDEVR